MQKVADEVAALGRKAYVIPGGGSNPLGALGYVSCAEEILAQTHDLGLRLDHIVCASGSTGTHAGLICGLVGNNSQIPLTGINVRRTRQEQEPNVHKLAQETAALLGIPGGIPREAITALGDWVGPGYSLPTPEMIDAVRMLARVEGILLDPVYTGKAMAGLIALVRRGTFKAGQRVLFVHTGGAPALYAYQSVLSRSVMTRVFRFLTVIVMALCLTGGALAAAQDKPKPPADPLTGTWEGTVQLPDGSMPLSMTLKLDGAKVDGRGRQRPGRRAHHRRVVGGWQVDHCVHLRGRRRRPDDRCGHRRRAERQPELRRRPDGRDVDGQEEGGQVGHLPCPSRPRGRPPNSSFAAPGRTTSRTSTSPCPPTPWSS